MINLSIVIPIAPREKAWVYLWEDLKNLRDDVEIIFVGPEKPTQSLPEKIVWVTSPLGRAQQLNKGAESSHGKFLWFLHADSSLTKETFSCLEKALIKNPNNLYYFDLRFLSDGPSLMFLNEIGVRFRSDVLGNPFGDQGLFLSRKNFERIGGFPTNVSYGEDHVFVWNAWQHGIKVTRAKATILTSARKYLTHGWFKTTLLHYRLWTKQAAPERRKYREIMKKKRLNEIKQV